MQLLQQNSLNDHSEKHRVVNDTDRNCFKLHMQLVICQSIQQKHKFNKAKIKAVQNLERHFLKVKDKVTSATDNFSNHIPISIAQTLKFPVVNRLLYGALGVFESERFIKKLDTWNEDYEFTFNELKESLNEAMEADLDNCINKGFTATENVVKSDISRTMLEKCLISALKTNSENSGVYNYHKAI